MLGTRVDRVFQPNRDELILAFRGFSAAYKLLISARANSARVNLTTIPVENPQQPPMLCMLLRKKLQGAKLLEITQPDLERALMLKFDSVNELGDHVELTLAVEIMGRYSNIILVDENGKMTGLLKESACTYMWDKVVYTKEEYMRSFKAANDLLLSFGVTSMHDGSFYGEETIGLYQEACREGLIKVRMYVLLYHAYGKKKTIEWVNRFISTGIHGGLGDEHFRLGHVKILIDGSTSGPSCATKEPYSHDPSLKGIQIYTQEEADDIIIKAHNAGFNVTAHAVGDAAVDVILTSIERAMAQNPRPCRHRIDHCGIVNEELLDRIQKAGIVTIPNPGFFNENAEIYVKYYGDRVNYMFPLKSYLDRGITAALGSDAPVIEADPMIGIYGALARADKVSGTVAGECQRIGIMDAIRMYTYNGAYASLEEDIKGSIEPGKLADLVVLSENILETPLERIKSVKADMTILDGEVVYEREL